MIGFAQHLKIAALAVAFPLLAVAAFLAAVPASAALPAVIVPCSTPALVIAISAAVTGGGNQSLTLSPGCTYTLTTVNNGSNADTNGLPLITNTVQLTIDGSGATIVRDAAAPRFRLFQVGAGASLALDNLILAGGHTPDGVSGSHGRGGDGAAIFNDGGTVTVTTSTISGNRTGSGGSCCSNTAQGDGRGGLGGGFYDAGGVLNVISSTIAGNATGDGGSAGSGDGGAGGGLSSNEGIVIVTNSTISGNSTGQGNQSSILQGAGQGGGIAILNGTLIVANSTIAGNSTGNNFNNLIDNIGLGGGIIVESGAMTVTNSTIAKNTLGSNSHGGGYVAAGSPAVLKNTLIAANAAENCVGTPAAGSTHNMADSGECGASFTQRTPAQINLGPLQNNGGPTLTMALRFPSAAIDAGDDASCPAVDQRGLPRPHGLHCDIGAYEFETTLSYLFLPLVLRDSQPAPVVIDYSNFVITPSDNHIRVGQTVAFVIHDGPHEPYNATGVYQFDSGPNLSNTTYYHQFNQAGTITLLCAYHSNMTAQLTISP